MRRQEATDVTLGKAGLTFVCTGESPGAILKVLMSKPLPRSITSEPLELNSGNKGFFKNPCLE